MPEMSAPDWSENDSRHMGRALDLAREGWRAGEVPVGAVLVQQGRVLAEAYNHPIALHDPTAHAEIRTLRAAGAIVGNYRLPGSVLYVTLEPCAMCAMALLHARVARVVYAAPDLKTGACGSVVDLFAHRTLNHQTVVQGGLLAQQAGDLLRAFFRERRQAGHLHAHPIDPLTGHPNGDGTGPASNTSSEPLT